MARFVSPHRNYAHGVRAERDAYLGPDGRMVPAQTFLSADFSPDLREDSDVTLAKSVFTFRGLAIHENGQTVDPTYRVSVFDSEVAKLQNGWTDEDEAFVVDTLRNRGPIGQMYVEVLPVQADKPWNGYDDLDDAARIAELALAINADLEQVSLYESQHANRADVLEALTAAKTGGAETIIVSA